MIRANRNPGKPMRFVRALLIALVVLAVVVLAAGLFLPQTAHVERSVLIDAPPAEVYEVVSSMRRFNEWSPWFERDPDARYDFTGPQSGVGAKMSWSSDQADVGVGSQEIIAVEPDRSVTTRLNFGPEGDASAMLTIEPQGNASKVTWSFDASFEDDYFGRYFGALLDGLLGPDYERGLAKLKAVVEQG